MTQQEKIKRHLEIFGSITPMDAMMDYGIMRLGARIFELKESGVDIKTRIIKGKNRFGETTHFAEYRLENGYVTTTGQLIKAARKRVGLTQSDLAAKLGITYQSIGQWERGIRKPKLETIKKIGAALEIDWGNLIP